MGAKTLPLNWYKISSSSGSLSTAWNRFSLQGIDPVEDPNGGTPGPGNDSIETWTEFGGKSNFYIGEAFLLGVTKFGPTDSRSLAGVYTGGAGGAEDLVFTYGLASGEFLTGNVRYVTSAGIADDYNGDGVVNAADYTLFHDTLGSTSNLAADGNGNNIIDSGDYTVWRSNFGNDGSGSGSLAANVPEPTSLALAASCVGFLLVSFRRRRG